MTTTPPFRPCLTWTCAPGPDEPIGLLLCMLPPAVHAVSCCACCLLLSLAVWSALPYCTQSCAVLCCAVLCCAVLCCAVLCCAVPQQVMSAHTCFCLSISFNVAMSLVHGHDKWHMTCNAITLHLQLMMSALMRPCFEYGA